jgi:hypothetical protein
MGLHHRDRCWKFTALAGHAVVNREAPTLGNARWRMACLVLLLILGQVVMLHHVVHHQLEHLFTQQDDDSCSFCAIGGHMASNVLPPPSMPSLVWAHVVYLFPPTLCLTSHGVQTLRVRGPPLLSVA